MRFERQSCFDRKAWRTIDPEGSVGLGPYVSMQEAREWLRRREAHGQDIYGWEPEAYRIVAVMPNGRKYEVARFEMGSRMTALRDLPLLSSLART
jgi:hypothetical protein